MRSRLHDANEYISKKWSKIRKAHEQPIEEDPLEWEKWLDEEFELIHDKAAAQLGGVP
jgi:hypothetical protein